MSDKETKGAYVPFSAVLLAAYYDAREWQSFAENITQFENAHADKTQKRKSLDHYHELLRLHNLEEVK